MTIPQLPIVVNPDVLLAALKSKPMVIRHDQIRHEHCESEKCSGQLMFNVRGRIRCDACGQIFRLDDPDNREQAR